jgi:hypothetical protein
MRPARPGTAGKRNWDAARKGGGSAEALTPPKLYWLSMFTA